MEATSAIEPRWIMMHPVATLLMAFLVSTPAAVQGLDNESAIETIIGSEVKTAEIAIGDDADRVLSAIENAAVTAHEVRRRFNVGKIEIVLLTDTEGRGASAARDALGANKSEIADLRLALEESALFYHARRSHGIEPKNVIALEFDGDDVNIFALPNSAQ